MPASPKTQRKTATSAKAWKGKTSKPVPLDLPSGNTCLVRRMPITKMLTSGIIPDAMRPIILEALKDGGEKPEEKVDMSALMEDEGKLDEMFQTFDRVLVSCCVDPAVAPAPENDEDRDEETLYADDVDMEDKIHIFQFVVGGDSDASLSEFRSGA